MSDILKKLSPIRLLKGSHPDTGKTGQGCFMNVVAYLNGEPQITDRSSCVCPTIRPIAIWLNDYMTDAERGRMLPFVMRAMGTATDDRTVVRRRLSEVVNFADDMAAYADDMAAYADRAAAAYADRAAARAARAARAAAARAARAARAAAARYAADADAAADAARYAAAAAAAADLAAVVAAVVVAAADAVVAVVAADAADAAAAAAAAAATHDRAEIINRGLKLMEAVCPPLSEPAAVVAKRAQDLVTLAQKETHHA